MRRDSSRAGARKAGPQLLEKGIAAFAFGAAMWLMPLFLGNSPALVAVGRGMRSAAPFALVIGAVLIALHLLLRRREPQNSMPENMDPAWTSWLPPDEGLGNDHPFPNTGQTRPSAAATEKRPTISERTPRLQWTGRVFDDIEWRRFEAVCEKLFGQAGFDTRSQSHGADGGVDIWLHSRHAAGPVAVVQCKHWSGKPVGVKEMREFFGVMASHKLKRGTYAATSTFTPDAAQFAKEHGINALDGDRLLALIATRTPEQQLDLLKTAYEGDYWRPTCASCGVKMVERKSRKDASGFWGCAQFPKCKARLPMRASA